MDTGLTVGNITSAYSDTVPVGHVISQDPVDGTRVILGTAVDLVVSSGPQPVEEVDVPTVTGITQAAAEAAIVDTGLTVGNITSAYSDTVPAGHVISQEPAEGTQALLGTVVNLVVSLGQAGHALPPDPAAVAPALDPTVPTDIFTSTAFLYNGAVPIQTGMLPETIEERRVCVMRGLVTTRDGDALPGVRITALNHPEYGQTLSRADGMFDFVVNGGGYVVLNYQKDGYLPAQRQVKTPWKDFIHAPEVALIPLDTRVTTIDFSEPIQVARSNPVTDADGTRTPTLFFPQDAGPKMVLRNGAKKALGNLEMRITEYSVGDRGQEAMPAELPPTTAYTHCVEMTVDQAIKSSAKTVEFENPPVYYVENFVGFSTGVNVPTGLYNRETAQWEAVPDGRVIKLVGITDDLADLDIDIEEGADDNASLAALGITTEEREHLAMLYEPGQSLWRIPIPHFSPCDPNWPAVPPEGAGGPRRIGRPGGEPDPCELTGSVVEVQSQVLRESVPITGTEFALHYSTDRIPAPRAYQWEIPLTSGEVHEGLAAVQLNVEIAGRQFSEEFAPAMPNLTHLFVWDGYDAYGRRPQGRQQVQVRIGYRFTAVYAEQATEGQIRSFGRIMARGGGSGGGGGGGSIVFEGNMNPRVADPPYVTFWQNSTALLGVWDAGSTDLGGWTLDVHHRYNNQVQEVYYGDGRTLSTRDNIAVNTLRDPVDPENYLRLRHVADIVCAPDGSIYATEYFHERVVRIDPDGAVHHFAGSQDGSSGFSGDGGPAVDAMLNHPSDLACAPDGSVYINDWLNRCIRKVDPQGIIKTVIGNPDLPIWEPDGDGGLAADGKVTSVNSLSVGNDGTLYFLDSNRVRAIGTDGYVTTVAGTGNHGFGGDGGPAIEATFNNAAGVAVGPDGSLYIADNNNNRIRKVSVDGIISTVAGSGANTSSPEPFVEGGPAIEAALSYPHEIYVDANGVLYFKALPQVSHVGESPHYCVYYVDNSGSIFILAGSGRPLVGCTSYVLCDEGVAARLARMEIDQVAFSPIGTLYLTENRGFLPTTSYIRMITAPLVFLVSTGEAFIPSADGREVYCFDRVGRHLDTLDTYTKRTLYAFGYDATGRLVSVENPDGGVTVVERDASGAPKAIVSPYGQRTILAKNVEGYLDSIANPAGDSLEMTYADYGLLDTFTDGNGGITLLEYDALGNLVRHENPAGKFQTLESVLSGYGYQVTLTTALGRQIHYNTEYLEDGNLYRGRTEPSGATTSVIVRSDGIRETSYPDGSMVTQSWDGDPRFGMKTPVLREQSIETPHGVRSDATATRAVTLSDPTDLFSVETLMDTLEVDGAVITTNFNAEPPQSVITHQDGSVYTLYFDENGRLIEENFWPALDPRTYEYDALGRTSRVALGSRIRDFDYDALGRISEMTEVGTRQWSYRYDAADRLTELTLPSGHSYSFAYDGNGNQTGMRAPSGALHQFQYTAANRDAGYTTPGGNTYITDYDADGNMAISILPSGRITEYIYDTDGSVIGVVYPEASVTLDSLSGCCGPAVLTRTPVVGPVQSLSTGNDGFLVEEMLFTGAANGRYTYTYGLGFMLTGIALDDGAAIVIERGTDGLVTAFGPFTINRSGLFRLQSQISDGTLALTCAYDSQTRLSSRTCTVGGTTLYTYTLSYDVHGFLIQRVENKAGVDATFDYNYDIDGRLITVTRNGSVFEAYSYDLDGNRTSRHAGTDPYQEATYDIEDRIISHGDVAYVVDDDGWLAVRGEDAFDYSARGELLGAYLADGSTIFYAYDGFGRRVARSEEAETWQYLYGYPEDAFRITAAREPGDILWEFYYDDLGVLYAFQRAGTWYYVGTDPVGTPQVISDALGTIVKTLSFDAFGVLLTDTNPGLALPIGFAGGLADPLTGLVRFGMRDYDPASGRWTARDPLLVDGGGSNFYAYARNNPVCFRDPTGAFCVGGSFYKVYGAGARVCITREGFSVCAMPGLGVGGGLDINPLGDLDRTRVELEAVAMARLGPAQVGFGLNFSECGLRGGIKCQFGPADLCGNLLQSSTPNRRDVQDLRDARRGSFRTGISARINAIACWQRRF